MPFEMLGELLGLSEHFGSRDFSRGSREQTDMRLGALK
jgi:hypothetical protein